MIELAHNFGSKAAAVGIETAEDMRKLASLGCDTGQGYLFAKPMTEQELMGMVMAARGVPKSDAQAPNLGAAKAAAG
jgi:EAL domain-containing protein (putative c-di-GMP-specific phosphodiesterase class I)